MQRETTGNGAVHAATFAEALAGLDAAEEGLFFFGPRGALREELPFARLAEEAADAAGRLLGLGLAPGDRVGILAETEADFVRAFCGCILARLLPCPMPLPVAFGSRAVYAEQLRRIADVADIRAALAPAEFADWAAEGLADRRLVHLGTLAEVTATPEALPPPPAPGDLAYLQFSSGTTRAPKGIAVTHRALMANLRGMGHDALDVGPQDRGVSWLPLYHDMGLVGSLLMPIAMGMSVDHLATRDFIRRPGLWLELAAARRATISYAPSFGYQLAARRARLSGDADLSAWRVAGIGGDMVRPEALDGFAETFAPAGFRREAFLPSYGLAEATLGLSFSRRDAGWRLARPAGDGAAAVVSCGAPLPGHRIEIRDDAGRPLPEGTAGRVHAWGPSLMEGYFRDPAQTAEALADGWLDTGDLGFLRDGELAITGRAKDLVILNGRNIWPQDLEWAVEDAVAGLRSGDVAAFGEMPEQGPEELVLVVRCRPRDPEARAALRAQVEAALAAATGLKARIALSDDGLPRTSSGKLSRARVRDAYRSGGYDG
ncbi:fatty acyl-AMP ligase [Albimonas pacifica]|nr:fatty acyl-AMP ligase [Albimonas pacifica]